MEKLPVQTNKILRKIDKLQSFDIKPSNVADFTLLLCKGYIQIHKKISPQNLVKESHWIDYITITQQGRIYLATVRDENIRFYVPIVITNFIAIISLIVSIISIIMQK
ncbi:hypothetical protein [Thomasclavelia spiroformis]|uniref:hypothetical protein n=1 Tax=Thomasclavelia spiroformis TaxID=29348 RepID=UPI002941C6B7|nr:hypothetical protein [Thomasclavelia spiroformis]